jgi:iron complex transport system substrate-binding protein
VRRPARLLALILLLAGPAAAAPWSVEPPAEASKPARRIVSLVPSVTEILYAVGAQDRLVGVTDFCTYPPEARRKPSVGGMVSPSLETVVSLKPDVVVVTTAGNREETFGQLRRLGIPTVAVNPTTVSEVLEIIERVGALTEHPAEAGRLVTSLRSRAKAVSQRVVALARPRVLYVVWPEPLIVPGRASLVSELIELAGGRSVTLDAGEGYPRYSVEAALAHSPEVILLARHGFQNRPLAREQWERFSGLPAVRNGRLHAVDGDIFHRYGPRMIDGLESLARLFHPEAFSRTESHAGSPR